MKQYTLDTNIFRHKTNDNDSPDLRIGAAKTWAKMLQEVNDNQAVLMVPKEVIRELNLQSFTLNPKQNKGIAQLISLCKEVEPDNYNIDVEYSLRNLAAYVRCYSRTDFRTQNGTFRS